MAPSDQTFTLKMSSFTDDNLSSKKTATLQIRMRHRYQVHLQTYNDAGTRALIFFDEAASQEVTSNHFAMPPPVITLLPLRRLFVLNALARLHIEGSLCQCLGPRIEKYVFRTAENFGFKGFGVVADLEVTKAYVYDHKTGRSLMAAAQVPTLKE